MLLSSRNSFKQLREALQYVYTNHIDEFDWILKTTDRSYVVLENLRHLLYQYDTEWPLVIGQRFLEEDYMPGVYAISRNSFTRVIQDGFTNDSICEKKSHDADKAIAKCFQHLNVLKIDGIDSTGRGQFFQNRLELALFPEKTEEYDSMFWHKLKQGIDSCCSDRLVALQGLYSSQLYYMEYFIYKVHAFGRHRKHEPLPPKKLLKELIEKNY